MNNYDIHQIKTFNEFNAIIQSTTNVLIVVDFFAEWCGPCQKIKPKVDKLCSMYPSVMFYKVDVDQNTETTEKCGIKSMPTFVLFVNGKVKDRLEGGDILKLEELIKKYKTC